MIETNEWRSSRGVHCSPIPAFEVISREPRRTLPASSAVPVLVRKTRFSRFLGAGTDHEAENDVRVQPGRLGLLKDGHDDSARAEAESSMGSDLARRMVPTDAKGCRRF
jgi:hypothetical protein